MKKLLPILLYFSFFSIACNNNGEEADAFGNFESQDQMVTSETNGKLLFFNVEEGQLIEKGTIIGLIDTTQLHLKKLQLDASIAAIKGKLQDAGPQLRLIDKKIKVLDKEKQRVLSLLKDEAATQKQLDDIQGQLDILNQQKETLADQTTIANRALLSQIAPLKVQIEQVNDQINRCNIVNPITGTVLLKLAEAGDIVSPVKPLYKIADIAEMQLRAYISGDQLPHISIGQKVFIEIDENKDENKRIPGTISWISDRAEFTPKTIQTKEERVNMVYAFKVQADNAEGKLKIGMPGEVHFKNSEEE